jgi:CopG family nickel-responsive transcriptional regulator
MSEIVRFSVSLESDLLEQFQEFCTQGKFATRSEAIRQLLREKLTSAAWTSSAVDVAASLTLVYDHHRARLMDKMIEIQHAHQHGVVASQHVHLTHDLCMEVIILRGRALELQHLASELSGLKGIYQAQLVIVRAESKGEPTFGHPSSGGPRPTLPSARPPRR